MAQIKSLVEKIISFIPYVGKWRSVFLKHSYPGHFYSPITDLEWIKSRKDKIYDVHKNILDVDLNESFQKAMAKELVSFHSEHKEFLLKCRFFIEDNIYFTGPDALTAHFLIRKYRPKKIFEIGSGFSSALMHDINSAELNSQTELLHIEPNPQRLFQVLDKNKIKYVKAHIQDVDPRLFEELSENDILFVDGSHVSKTDSDLNHVLFNILPRLNKGVIIHFHDVFYPFEYPMTWLEQGISWNEIFLLRSFLMNNSHYKILFWNSYIAHFDEFRDVFNPGYDENTFCSSLWLQKM